LRIGKTAEEDAVHDAEDGCPGADADGHCGNSGDGEHRRAEKPAQGVADVLCKDLEVLSDGHPGPPPEALRPLETKAGRKFST
jgi:hypothetical protein